MNEQPPISDGPKRKKCMCDGSVYRAWMGMKYRCMNTNAPKYNIYGGRGIKVCKRWLKSFKNFKEDMGEKPSPKHSLERKNNNGNYTPSNCIWGTRRQQQNNRSINVFLEFNGERKTLAQWSAVVGIKQGTLSTRARTSGLSDAEILTIPAGKLKSHLFKIRSQPLTTTPNQQQKEME